MFGAASLAALRQQGEIRAASWGCLALSLAEQLHGRTTGKGIVAGVEAIATNDLELGDGIRELGQADASLAHAGVDAHALLSGGVGTADGHAGGEERRAALIGEDVGAVVADVGCGAVDVEDAAGGGGGVVHEHGIGSAGTGVGGGQDEVVDRGREVVCRDISYQAEVGRCGLGRVDWAGGGRSSAGDAHEAQDGGEGES